MKRIKEPVRIRMKELKDGNQSIYLDIYYEGERHYEFLKLYIIPERNKADRDANKATMALAASIKAKRIMELQSCEHGFKSKKDKVLFFDYFRSVMNEKSNDGTNSNYKIWTAVLNVLLSFEKNQNITLRQVTEEWIEKFIKYLNNYETWTKSGRLCHNTRCQYVTKVNECLRHAVKDGLINSNPMERVERASREEVERNFLTIDELRKLAATDCPSAVIKNAFMFSCLTGLRWSDVSTLKWKDVETINGNTRITFRQQKTKGLMYLDITAQAVEYMGNRTEGTDKVFNIGFSKVSVEKKIRRWVLSAGIDKDITFHCARHSFAIMMLDLGVDIYTISKLLGHRNIGTTQIYAKVLDKNKQEAVNRIPKLL